jgi:hypothetical protein
VGRLERLRFLALDALLAADELAGLTLSNRPPRGPVAAPASIVLVADRFPERGDPARPSWPSLTAARVEATARPALIETALARTIAVDYREDDGVAERALALVALAAMHPLRCLRDRARSGSPHPPLAALAPAARRLQRDAGAPIRPIGGQAARVTAARLAAVTGRGGDRAGSAR